MTGRDMLAVGVRNVVLARGMFDKLEGPKYAERRAELRRKAREAARARDRQTTAASQIRLCINIEYIAPILRGAININIYSNT